MAHVDKANSEQLEALTPVLEGAKAAMGFIPNSMLTMAHMPQLTMAFSMFAGVVFGRDLGPMFEQYAEIVPQDAQAADAITPDQVQLIAYSASLSAGCLYCQAHTSHNAHRFGVPEEKLQAILDADNSPLFSDAERALVAVALAAGQVPNEAKPEHFAALKVHFTDRQIVQIVGVISLFGFLNRWNDTMATQLEAEPIEFAQRVLSEGGWAVGKHGS